MTLIRFTFLDKNSTSLIWFRRCTNLEHGFIILRICLLKPCARYYYKPHSMNVHTWDFEKGRNKWVCFLYQFLLHREQKNIAFFFLFQKWHEPLAYNIDDKLQFCISRCFHIKTINKNKFVHVVFPLLNSGGANFPLLSLYRSWWFRLSISYPLSDFLYLCCGLFQLPPPSQSLAVCPAHFQNMGYHNNLITGQQQNIITLMKYQKKCIVPPWKHLTNEHF